LSFLGLSLLLLFNSGSELTFSLISLFLCGSDLGGNVSDQLGNLGAVGVSLHSGLKRLVILQLVLVLSQLSLVIRSSLGGLGVLLGLFSGVSLGVGFSLLVISISDELV
jgi:hypothetical protein